MELRNNKYHDNKHQFNFIYEGEIRFGPKYYTLKLDGQEVSNRIFGDEFLWHYNSTYLALQEWLTTDYHEGPITVLTLVDLANRRLARISKAHKGFIKPTKFENDYIIFEKVYPSTGKIIEYEIKLEEIKNWE